MTELDAQAQMVDHTYVGAIDRARIQLREQTSELSGLLENTALAARIAPAMLGGDGPRSYFMGFQTNAEARGTGGLMGGFAILRAEDGAVRVDDVASNRELRLDYAPIDLGPDFTRLYGPSRPTQDFRNSNVSSHFPYAARIWQSIWKQESGESVDGGVIATDPVALSYVLDVVGAVTMPDGEKITAENVVELTGSTAYARFGDDQKARKEYLETIARKVVVKLTGDIDRPRALLEALGRAASEGRLAVWSSHGDEQEVLATTALGHSVPEDPAPYAGVVVNNLGGNKLDYFLERGIDYTAGSCVGQTRTSTVTIRLSNTLPSGEHTAYVAGMFDNPMGAPVGTNLTDVSLLATQGARLERVTVGGRPAFALTGKELGGHPVFGVQLPVPQGATVEVVYELTEPVVGGRGTGPGAAAHRRSDGDRFRTGLRVEHSSRPSVPDLRQEAGHARRSGRYATAGRRARTGAALRRTQSSMRFSMSDHICSVSAFFTVASSITDFLTASISRSRAPTVASTVPGSS